MAKKPQTDTDEVKLSYLEQLTAARDIKGIAKLIGYPTKSLAYVLYKIPNENKYKTFSIPKKNGGERIIHAPNAELKIIQKRLATYLLNCIKELEDKNKGRKTLSHAFQADRSIVTNAAIHTNRRYVLNLDLENFFGTINFGRVRGFFIKDRNFNLSEKAATILAQIACHDNCLPQGSPCSPVISNLIGHIIDVRLVRLAKVYKCTYSRYADDITFSTNKKIFPKHLAKKMFFSTNKWKIGAKLKKEIIRCGFTINESKTRMQIRGSRQETTGLVVNSKVNIKQEYYRNVRAMCHSLFKSGTYYVQGSFDESGSVKKETNLKKLEGMLCHIDYVKQRKNIKDRKKKKGLMPDALQSLPEAPKELYEKFLFYKYFLANDKPLLLTEGKTDITYLKSAITSLQKNNPMLFKEKEFLVSFFNNSQTKREILGINEGAGSFPFLISNYSILRSLNKHMFFVGYNPEIICDGVPELGPLIGQSFMEEA